MKILVIVIRYNPNNNRADYTYLMPVGLAYISSVLKNKGYEVKYLNLNHCDGTIDDLIRKTLLKEKYDFILTGGLSVHYSAIKTCVDSVRKYAPHAQIVLGGGIISSQPELMFKALKPDYSVIGEGEMTITELLKCLENDADLKEIDGLGYQGSEGKLVLTKAREAIKDIDSIPWPDYEGLGLDAYLDHMRPSHSYYYDLFDSPRAYPLISSRSCPFSCTFCFHPIGNKYRQRTVTNIMEELNFAIKRYRVNIIDIYDELFSNDKNRVLEFCKQIKELFKKVPWEVKWNCQMRVDKLDEEIVVTMKDAGCYIFSLGLESYSHTVLKSMKKHITPQQIDRALQIARRLDLTIQGNFIFGDVAETTETAYETLNYWKKNFYGGGIRLAFIEPYPGTALYKHCLNKGLIKDEIDFIENRMTKPINMSNTMTDKEFSKLEIDMYEAQMKYRKYVEPFSVIKSNDMNEIHVKCPYCNKISVYKNYVIESKYHYKRDVYKKDVCCRNCRKRFCIISLFSKIEIIMFKLIGAKNTYFVRNLLKKVRSFVLKYRIYGLKA